MIGVNAFDFVTAAEKQTASDSLQRRKIGLKGSFDTSFCHKNGTEVSVNIAGSPLVDGEGQHVGSLGVVRDVTERRKMQSQLMVSDRMASVGTLAAGVAHEINNPLAAVTANLECIADSLDRVLGGSTGPMSQGQNSAWYLEEVKTPLDDARSAAERVRCVVRDLMIFSRSPTDESGAV